MAGVANIDSYNILKLLRPTYYTRNITTRLYTITGVGILVQVCQLYYVYVMYMTKVANMFDNTTVTHLKKFKP